jgi:hypothetical protein
MFPAHTYPFHGTIAKTKTSVDLPDPTPFDAGNAKLPRMHTSGAGPPLTLIQEKITAVLLTPYNIRHCETWKLWLTEKLWGLYTYLGFRDKIPINEG